MGDSKGASALLTFLSSGERGPIPRRGQIKSQIAATALNSIAAALARAAAPTATRRPDQKPIYGEGQRA
ncbi:unnamed protein product [Spirodela intermedia]|uniref:Uncharacterized protein n=2 Tax=Spirodela intermedia TaxID=51605 RepID=A0A7I8J9X0_SPIIN|nr:unnamed protein product [Spirodela intermedia]CAA6666947.1 unnamed protein product [Spirodela intermedia]CAA7403754.1 unnamed protein product [Spirodela intermedia]